jgi:Fe2+ or Zn2+ uptake regulation protein
MDGLFAWLRRAGLLPGKSTLRMAVCIRATCHKYRRDTLPLYPEFLERNGFSRVTAYRALRTLEQAELIEVERHRGRRPFVRLIHCADSETAP